MILRFEFKIFLEENEETELEYPTGDLILDAKVEEFEFNVSSLMGNFDNINKWSIDEFKLNVWTKVDDFSLEELSYELYGMSPEGLGPDGWMCGDINVTDEIIFLPRIDSLWIVGGRAEIPIDLSKIPKYKDEDFGLIQEQRDSCNDYCKKCYQTMSIHPDISILLSYLKTTSNLALSCRGVHRKVKSNGFPIKTSKGDSCPENLSFYKSLEDFGLTQEQRDSIKSLIPLIKDDGEIHKTESLPKAIYETPNHLNYACSLLPDTFNKKERLQVIDRTLMLSHTPFVRMKRYRGWGGPHSKMMWTIIQKDPYTRWSAPHIKWASSRDEARIKQNFWNLINSKVGKVEGVQWWRGGNDDCQSGRFYPIPKTIEDMNKYLSQMKEVLEKQGFEVKIGEW